MSTPPLRGGLNGNLSKKSAKISPKVLEYDFDLENRLKQVRIFENGTVLSTRLSYRYDALGRSIERKVEGAQTKVTQFVHDGQDVLLEQNQTGQLERTYIRGSGIDELYGVLEDVNQNGSIGASEAFYFRTDHLGSVREVVKSSGETKQNVTYSAYGEPVVTPAPGEVELNVSRLYTGRDYERETGDYYYRARWFNSSTQSFLSPDPIGFRSGDTNFYRYVNNNPIKYNDPSGNLSPASVTACAVLFAAGELYDIYSNFDDQFRLQQETQDQLDALDDESKTCSSKRKDQIRFEKDKIMKDFQKKSGVNVLGAFTPGAGAAFAAAGCVASLIAF